MNKENILREQEAPEKNSDGAFVQVNTNGSPALPHETESEEEQREKDRPKEGTLADR